MIDVANEINMLFRQYGLAQDIVQVSDTPRLVLDPRENEPDPRKWGAHTMSPPIQRLEFVGSADTDTMYRLLTHFRAVFDGYFEVHTPPGQLKLF